jgi:hypothetical protein
MLPVRYELDSYIFGQDTRKKMKQKYALVTFPFFEALRFTQAAPATIRTGRYKMR